MKRGANPHRLRCRAIRPVSNPKDRWCRVRLLAGFGRETLKLVAAAARFDVLTDKRGGRAEPHFYVWQ